MNDAFLMRQPVSPEKMRLGISEAHASLLQSMTSTTPASAIVPAVLIIDDDSAVLGSLTMLLETTGFRVLTARDGAQGLREFRKHSPAVVVTDILMPEQDGIGLIMQMRRERPKVKVIAISGGGRVGNSDFLTLAAKLGADAALPKPLDTDKLVDTIRNYLALGE